MRSQASRVERPSFLEVAVALAGLTFAAIVVIGFGWAILTIFLSAAQYLESAVR